MAEAENFDISVAPITTGAAGTTGATGLQDKPNVVSRFLGLLMALASIAVIVPMAVLSFAWYGAASLLANGPIFRKVSPGLSHEPNRRDRFTFARQDTKKRFDRRCTRHAPTLTKPIYKNLL